MANQFEHLQLPKTDIQFTKRPPRGFSGSKRANRSSHGRQLLSIDANNLKNAFVKASKNDNAKNLIEISLEDLKKQFKSITVDLLPGINLRKKGTLQKGEIKISSSNWKYDGNPMYVVVACNRKWAREDNIDSQRYALVVSVSHSDLEVNLYNQLQAQVQNKISQRVRIR